MKQLLSWFLLSSLVITHLGACNSQTVKNENDSKIKAEASAPTIIKKVDSGDFNPRGFDLERKIETLSFGSCLDQELPAPLLKTIEKANADLYIAMGDNIYASRPEQKPISDQYKKLLKNPDYRSLREKIPFMAIWDDHDYGLNDGGEEWSGKSEAREDFLKHFPYVKNSLSKGQEGLYHSKIFGTKKHLVQIILLDTRWFRSGLIKNPDTTNPLKKYIPNTDKKATLLGEKQWKWLEDELKKPADVRFLISSIQLIANDHSFEKWGLFPFEKERFFNLIKKSKPKNLFVLSGDRHIGTIAQQKIPGWGTLYDITASSINKSKDFSELDSTYLGASTAKENFGFATIDWDSKKIKIELRGMDNQVVNFLDLKLVP